jgi:hypothetical protein
MFVLLITCGGGEELLRVGEEVCLEWFMVGITYMWGCCACSGTVHAAAAPRASAVGAEVSAFSISSWQSS